MKLTKKEPGQGDFLFTGNCHRIRWNKLIIKKVVTKIVKLKMKCKILLKLQEMNKIANLLGIGEKQWECEL